MEGTQDRPRLATILAADVVGYGGPMARDEAGTARALRAHRAVIDELVAGHDGRIFDSGGDSVLAAFGSAVEAVRCALSIQDALRVRNAELEPDRQLRLRIGIAVGDVIVAGGDLLGDGVDVAAGLESIAEPGGICISGSAFEQVKDKLSVGVQDLGPQRVKNIPEPVAAFGIASAPVTLAAGGGPTASSPPSRPSRRWLAIAAAALVMAAVLAAVGFGFRGPLFQQSRSLSDVPEGAASDG